jgi:hypothetical protein
MSGRAGDDAAGSEQAGSREDGSELAGEAATLRHGDGEGPRPGEEALFAALDRTRADLAAAPAPEMPEGLAAVLQGRLDAERAAGSPAEASPDPVAGTVDTVDTVDTAEPAAGPRGRSSRPGRPPGRPEAIPARRARRARRRGLAYGLLALAGAAVVAGGLLGGLLAGRGSAPAPTAAPVAVSGTDPVAALRAGLGARDPGPLSDPARRTSCLAAHGVPGGTPVLGSRQVVVDGRPGTLLVLPTGHAARFRLLVVGPTCTAGAPDTLADLTVGG